MEKNELEKKYELMMIVDAKFNKEDKEAIFKETTDTIIKSGGKIINSHVWIEKHKLTFDIKKCKEGTYYIINFESGGNINEKVCSILKLNERILRFLITKTEPRAVLEAGRL